MADKLKCEIIKDLLPGYVEGLTSNDTNEAVEEHLKNCPDCQGAYERMKAPDDVIGTKREIEKEVDYLKGLKKHSRKKIGFFGFGIAVILLVILFLITRYGLNRTISLEEINYQWNIIKTEDGQNYFEIQGELLDDNYGVTAISFEGNADRMELTIEAVPRILFNYRNDKEILFRADIDKIPKEIEICGRVVYKDGVRISDKTSEIYETRHLYVGSAPDNSKTIESLGMYDLLGGAIMELSTDNEPYGCKLCLDRVVTKDMVTEKEKYMEAYSSVLIAMIGNLDYVEWEYRVGESKQVKVVTAEDAKKLTGVDVKSAYENVVVLQKIMMCSTFKDVFDLERKEITLK